MSNITINTPFNVPIDFVLASPRKRIFAYLIDFAILIGYLVTISWGLSFTLWDKRSVFSEFNSPSVAWYVTNLLFITLPMLFYSLFFETVYNGQTIGKKIIGTRVISMQGGPASFSQLLIRWSTKFFEWPFLFGFIYSAGWAIFLYTFITLVFGSIAFLIILISNKEQRLGDMAAGTVVIDLKPKAAVEDTVYRDIENVENYVVTYPNVMQLSDNDINIINQLIKKGASKGYDEYTQRVVFKIKQVLQITDAPYDAYLFLSTLINDYNYLANYDD